GNNGITNKSLRDFTSGTEGAVAALDRMGDLNYFDLEARKDIIHFGFRVKEKNYFSLNTSLRSHTIVTYPRDFATILFLGNGLAAGDPGAEGIPDDYLLLGKRANFDGT